LLKHIDYNFINYRDKGGENNKELFRQASHSDEGVDQAKYKFLEPRKYIIKVTIYDILFNLVNPNVTIFNVTIC